jgi:hypothetical protein
MDQHLYFRLFAVICTDYVLLLCLTEIKLNYFKDTDTQQDAFRKDFGEV